MNTFLPLVVAVVYDGLCTFEYGIVAEVFGLKRPELERELYEFSSVSIGAQTLTAHGGLEFTAKGTITDLENAHTIVIPGWRGKDSAVPSEICKRLQSAHERGARILSICSGSYVLAAAGLLSNKRATTHWQYIEDFQAKHPDIEVHENKLYIDEGGIITSAGSSAGIDACLYIVRCDYGATIANKVARRLVMQSHRHGAHAQLIERPISSVNDNKAIADLIVEIRSNLSEQYHISSLSEKVGMSSRTFQRHFHAFTGIPVMQWLVHERLNMVCELLESSTLTVETISQKAGFASAETLRYHFNHVLQSSPTAYRKMLR